MDEIAVIQGNDLIPFRVLRESKVPRDLDRMCEVASKTVFKRNSIYNHGKNLYRQEPKH